MDSNLDRTRLSERENEILDLAADGLTDQQIALRLGISAATVNSYWVRIRGKVGHLTKTELVARSLRTTASDNMEALLQSNKDLEAQVHTQRLDEELVSHAADYRAIVDCIPDAVIAVSESGLIVFSNSAAREMIGYEERHLYKSPVEMILPPGTAKYHRLALCEAAGKRVPSRLGVDRVFYLRRADGFDLRVFIKTKRTDTSFGPTAICLIRSFTEELDTLRLRAQTTLM